MNLPPRDPLGPPLERWNWVDEFVRGINYLAPPERQLVRWTPEEWNALMFLRWRVEHGRVPQ